MPLLQLCHSSTTRALSVQRPALPSIACRPWLVRLWASLPKWQGERKARGIERVNGMNAIIGMLTASQTRHQSQTNPPVPLRIAAWLSRLTCASYLPLRRGPPTGIHARLPLPCQNQPPATPACKFSPNFGRNPWPPTLLPIKHKEITQILQFRINGCRTQDPRPLSPPARHWCLQRAEDSVSS